MSFSSNRRTCFRLFHIFIVSILITSFLAYDITWANPEISNNQRFSDKLAPQSIFKSIFDNKNSRDVAYCRSVEGILERKTEGAKLTLKDIKDNAKYFTKKGGLTIYGVSCTETKNELMVHFISRGYIIRYYIPGEADQDSHVGQEVGNVVLTDGELHKQGLKVRPQVQREPAHKGIPNPALIAVTVLIISYWIIEGIMHTKFFKEGRFIDALLPSDPCLIVCRTFLTLSLLALGFIAQHFYNKYHRTMQELLESKEIYKESFRNAPVAFHRIDLLGNIAEVNVRWLVTFGYITKEDVEQENEKAIERAMNEVVGKSIFDFIVPEQRANAQQRFSERIMGIEPDQLTPRVGDREYLTKDGRRIKAETHDTILKDKIHHDPSGVETSFIDLTERREVERRLLEERNILRTIIDNMPDLIYVKNRKSEFIVANPGVAHLMGAGSPDELIGKTDHDFFPKELADSYRADEEAVMASGEPLIGKEEPTRGPDGKERWILTTKVPLKDSTGKVIGVIGIGRDIASLREKNAILAKMNEELELVKKRLEELTITDDMTGLFNRRFYNGDFDLHYRGWVRAEHPITFISIDIDHFKDVNDTYGHDIGDEVLKAVANVIRVEDKKGETRILRPGDGPDRLRRDTDFPIRMGGEEFLIALFKADADFARRMAEKLAQRIRDITLVVQHKGKPVTIKVTVSMGIAQYSGSQQSPESKMSLLKRADQALYQAKNTGRNRIVVWSPELAGIMPQQNAEDSSERLGKTGDGTIAQGKESFERMVKGNLGCQNLVEAKGDYNVRVDIRQMLKRVGARSIEDMLGSNKEVRVVVTDAVVTACDDFCFGFYSHAPPVKGKLIALLGQSGFDAMFPKPTLVLTTEALSNPNPSIRQEYILHEILCSARGDHYKAIFEQQDKFPENYKDGAYQMLDGKKYMPDYADKPDRDLHPFKGALGAALRDTINRIAKDPIMTAAMHDLKGKISNAELSARSILRYAQNQISAKDMETVKKFLDVLISVEVMAKKDTLDKTDALNSLSEDLSELVQLTNTIKFAIKPRYGANGKLQKNLSVILEESENTIIPAMRSAVNWLGHSMDKVEDVEGFIRGLIRRLAENDTIAASKISFEPLELGPGVDRLKDIFTYRAILETNIRELVKNVAKYGSLLSITLEELIENGREYGFSEEFIQMGRSYKEQHYKEQHEELSKERLDRILGSAEQKQVPPEFVQAADKYRRPISVKISVTLPGDGEMRVTIKDDGKGVSAARLEKLFTPGVTESNDRNVGTGFGLASIKDSVDSVGGIIGVESKAGKGSVFSFTLPVNAPLDVMPRPALPSSVIVALSGLRGSGRKVVCRRIAAKLGLRYINMGFIMRILAYKLLEEQKKAAELGKTIDLKDQKEVAALIEKILFKDKSIDYLAEPLKVDGVDTVAPSKEDGLSLRDRIKWTIDKNDANFDFMTEMSRYSPVKDVVDRFIKTMADDIKASGQFNGVILRVDEPSTQKGVLNVVLNAPSYIRASRSRKSISWIERSDERNSKKDFATRHLGRKRVDTSYKGVRDVSEEVLAHILPRIPVSDGLIRRGERAFKYMVGEIIVGNFTDIEEQSDIGDDLKKISEYMGSLEQLTGSAEKVRVVLTESVILSNNEFSFGFYSHASPIREKLEYILKTEQFNRLFPGPTLVLSKDILAIPNRALRQHYILHSILCQTMGHERAICRERQIFYDHYTDSPGDAGALAKLLEEAVTGRLKVPAQSSSSARLRSVQRPDNLKDISAVIGELITQAYGLSKSAPNIERAYALLLKTLLMIKDLPYKPAKKLYLELMRDMLADEKATDHAGIDTGTILPLLDKYIDTGNFDEFQKGLKALHDNLDGMYQDMLSRGLFKQVSDIFIRPNAAVVGFAKKLSTRKFPQDKSLKKFLARNTIEDKVIELGGEERKISNVSDLENFLILVEEMLEDERVLFAEFRERNTGAISADQRISGNVGAIIEDIGNMQKAVEHLSLFVGPNTSLEELVERIEPITTMFDIGLTIPQELHVVDMEPASDSLTTTHVGGSVKVRAQVYVPDFLPQKVDKKPGIKNFAERFLRVQIYTSAVKPARSIPPTEKWPTMNMHFVGIGGEDNHDYIFEGEIPVSHVSELGQDGKPFEFKFMVMAEIKKEDGSGYGFMWLENEKRKRHDGNLEGDGRIIVLPQEKAPDAPASGGAIARGKAEELFKALKRRKQKPLRATVDNKEVVGSITDAVSKATMSDGERAAVTTAFDAFGKAPHFEFNNVILRDTDLKHSPYGWLLGFNTFARAPDAESDDPLHALQRLLYEKYGERIGLSAQVLDAISQNQKLLAEYIFHEVVCPFLGHEATRRLQEKIFPDNYVVQYGDWRDGHKDGLLALIIKDILRRDEAPGTRPKRTDTTPKTVRSLRTKDEALFRDYFEDLVEISVELFVLLSERKSTDARYQEEAEQYKDIILQRLALLAYRFMPENFSDEGPYRDIARVAKDRIVRTMQLIDSEKNEPAAHQCLIGIIHSLTDARIKMSEEWLKQRKSYRTRLERRDRILVLTQGRHQLSKGARHTMVDQSENKFHTLWDARRSIFDQIDSGMAEKRDTKAWADSMLAMRDTLKDKNSKTITQDELRKISEIIEKILNSMVKPGGRLKAEEKVMARILLDACRQIISISGGRYIKTVKKYLGRVEKLLRLRSEKAESISGSLHSGALQEVWEKARERDRWMMGSLELARTAIDKSEYQRALGYMRGISRFNAIKQEPEYEGIYDAIGPFVEGKQKIDQTNCQKLESDLEVFLRRADESGLLHTMLSKYRNDLIAKELASDEAADKEALLKEVFDYYVVRTIGLMGADKVRQRARFWAKLYQAVFIPRKIDNPYKRSERIPNPVFEAASKYIFILDFKKIKDLFEIPSFKKNRLMVTQDTLMAIGAHRANIVREDMPELVRALSKDYGLDADETRLLEKIIRMEERGSEASAQGATPTAGLQVAPGTPNSEIMALEERAIATIVDKKKEYFRIHVSKGNAKYPVLIEIRRESDNACVGTVEVNVTEDANRNIWVLDIGLAKMEKDVGGINYQKRGIFPRILNMLTKLMPDGSELYISSLEETETLKALAGVSSWYDTRMGGILYRNGWKLDQMSIFDRTTGESLVFADRDGKWNEQFGLRPIPWAFRARLRGAINNREQPGDIFGATVNLRLSKIRRGRLIDEITAEEDDSAAIDTLRPANMEISRNGGSFDSASEGDTTNPFILQHIDEGRALEIDERNETVERIRRDPSKIRGPPTPDSYRSKEIFEKIRRAKDPAILKKILEKPNFNKSLDSKEKDQLIEIVQKITLSAILDHAIIGEGVLAHARTGRHEKEHKLAPTIWIGSLLLDRIIDKPEELAQFLLEEAHHVLRPQAEDGKIAGAKDKKLVIEHDKEFVKHLTEEAEAAYPLQLAIQLSSFMPTRAPLESQHTTTEAPPGIEKAYIDAIRNLILESNEAEAGATLQKILAFGDGPEKHGGVASLMKAKEDLPIFGRLLIDEAIDIYTHKFLWTLLAIMYIRHEVDNIATPILLGLKAIKVTDEATKDALNKHDKFINDEWKAFIASISTAIEIYTGKNKTDADYEDLQLKWYGALVAFRKVMVEEPAALDHLLKGKDASAFKFSCQRMADILGIFIEYIKTGHLQMKFEKKDIHRFVSKYITDRPYEGVNTRFSDPVTSVDIETDFRLLEMIISNLARNACQAMLPKNGEGPKGEASTKPELTTKIFPHKDGVEITISDNGPGINPGDLSHIFDLLWTKNKKGGTGVGLALVKEMVERLGGSIWVQSELGKGTSFTIWLPSEAPGTASQTSIPRADVPRLEYAGDVWPAVRKGDVIELSPSQRSVYVTARFTRTAYGPQAEMWVKEKGPEEHWRAISMKAIKTNWPDKDRAFRFVGEVPPDVEKVTFIFYAEDMAVPQWWGDVGGRDLTIDWKADVKDVATPVDAAPASGERPSLASNMSVDRPAGVQWTSDVKVVDTDPGDRQIKLFGDCTEKLVLLQKAVYKGKVYWAKFAREETQLDQLENKFIVPQAQILRYLKGLNIPGLLLSDLFLEIEFPDGMKSKAILFEELPPGGTLEDKIKLGMSEKEAVDIMIKISRRMKQLHDAGVYHWDIKPQNIWITESKEVIIFDFDTAFRTKEEFMARDLDRVGTPLYSSQNKYNWHYAKSKAAFEPARDEIYALGLALLHMVMHGSANVYNIPRGYANEELRLLKFRAGRLALSRKLQAILAKALYEGRSNYENVDEFIRDLEAEDLPLGDIYDKLALVYHVDEKLVKTGLTAFRKLIDNLKLIKGLPKDLVERVSSDEGLIRIYTGATPAGQLSSALVGLGKSSMEILRGEIKKDENFRIVGAYVVNIEAASRVIKAHPEKFPAQNISDPARWVVERPDEWQRVRNIGYMDYARVAVRNGLLSGYPLNATEMYPFYLSAPRKLDDNKNMFSKEDLASLMEYRSSHSDRPDPALGDRALDILIRKAGFLLLDSEIFAFMNGYRLESAALGEFIAFGESDRLWVQGLENLIAGALVEASDIPAARDMLDKIKRSAATQPADGATAAEEPRPAPTKDKKRAPTRLSSGPPSEANLPRNASPAKEDPPSEAPTKDDTDSGKPGFMARGEPLELFFAFRDQFQQRQGELPPLRRQIDRHAIAAALRARLKEKETQLRLLPGGPNTYSAVSEAIDNLERLDALEFDAIVLDRERPKAAQSWLLGFNTNGAIPARNWVEPDEKTRLFDDQTENIFNKNLYTLLRRTTLGYATQVLDRLSGEALYEYLLHETLCPIFGHRRSRRIQEILFADTNYSRAPPQEAGKKDGPVSAALNYAIEHAPDIRAPQLDMPGMMRIVRERLMLRLNSKAPQLYSQVVEFGRFLLGGGSAHTDEDCIQALATKIMQSPGPLKVDPSISHRYVIFDHDGQLVTDIVANLFYEMERSGVIAPEVLFQTLQKYIGDIIEARHSCYPYRPPLRDDLTSIDISYSTKGGGGIGDIKQSITVAKIVKRRFPNVRVRLLRHIGDEDEIRLFYKDFDPKAGRNVFDGIEIVFLADSSIFKDHAGPVAHGSADITIFNDSGCAAVDGECHSPVKILVDEYGWKDPVDIDPTFCPSIVDRVLTGPGEGLFLSKDMERIRTWWTGLSPEEKARQRRVFAEKLLECAPKLNGQPISEEVIDALTSGKWAWMYAGDARQKLNDNIFYQSIAEMKISDRRFFFTINLNPDKMEPSIPVVRRPQDILGAGPGSMSVIALKHLDNKDFLKLMLMSDLPFMITGDGSLTEAIQSRKPFMYEARKHKLMLRTSVPFYFIADSYRTGVGMDQKKVDEENAEQKRRFKEFLGRNYPNFPSTDLPVHDVEERIVNAINSSWQAHRARLNDPAFIRLYNGIELRILEGIIPGSMARYLPYGQAGGAAGASVGRTDSGPDRGSSDRGPERGPSPAGSGSPITRAEIERVMDEINGRREIVFEGENREAIIKKLLSFGLVKSKRVLVAGTGSGDYLPIVLAKLGLETSIIETQSGIFDHQKELHESHGLGNKIRAFSSYDEMAGMTFDYIFALGVINNLTSPASDNAIMRYYREIMHGPNETPRSPAQMEEYCEKKIEEDLIRPLIDHLNRDGGMIFVNSTAGHSAEACERSSVDILFTQKDIFYLKRILEKLSRELGINFVPQPQADLKDFTLSAAHMSEGRTGMAYKACPRQTPVQGPPDRECNVSRAGPPDRRDDLSRAGPPSEPGPEILPDDGEITIEGEVGSTRSREIGESIEEMMERHGYDDNAKFAVDIFLREMITNAEKARPLLILSEKFGSLENLVDKPDMTDAEKKKEVNDAFSAGLRDTVVKVKWRIDDKRIEVSVSNNSEPNKYLEKMIRESYGGKPPKDPGQMKPVRKRSEMGISKASGTGRGIAISKKAIENQRGRVPPVIIGGGWTTFEASIEKSKPASGTEGAIPQGATLQRNGEISKVEVAPTGMAPSGMAPGKGAYATGLGGQGLPRLSEVGPHTIAEVLPEQLNALVQNIEQDKWEDANRTVDGFFWNNSAADEVGKLRNIFSHIFTLARKSKKIKELLLRSLRSPPLGKDKTTGTRSSNLSEANGGISMLTFAVSPRLPINAARYFNAAEKKATIVFNADFFNLDKYVDPGDDGLMRAAYHVRAERLMHELGHDNTIGSAREEVAEEAWLIATIDAPLWLCTQDIKGLQRDIDRLHRIEQVHGIMRSGGIFTEMVNLCRLNCRAMESFLARRLANIIQAGGVINGKAFPALRSDAGAPDRAKIEQMAKQLFEAGVKASQVYAYLNALGRPRPVDEPDYLAVFKVVGYQPDRKLMDEVARAVAKMETRAGYESLTQQLDQRVVPGLAENRDGSDANPPGLPITRAGAGKPVPSGQGPAPAPVAEAKLEGLGSRVKGQGQKLEAGQAGQGAEAAEIKDMGVEWPEEPKVEGVTALDKVNRYNLYLSKLIGIIANLDNAPVWTVGESVELGRIEWDGYLGHPIKDQAHKISNIILKIKIDGANIEDSAMFVEHFSKLKYHYLSLQQMASDDLAKRREATTESGTESDPIPFEVLGPYFFNKIFVEHPKAERNRQIFREATRRMKAPLAEMEKAVEEVVDSIKQGKSLQTKEAIPQGAVPQRDGAIDSAEVAPAGMPPDNTETISKEEIQAAIDDINRIAGNIVFNESAKDKIVQKILGMRLVKNASFLVVGPGGLDYLPVMLAKLKINVSVIDTDLNYLEKNRKLQEGFILDNKISFFSSYDGLEDRQFDYIGAFGVLHYVINPLLDKNLGIMAKYINDFEDKIEDYCQEKMTATVRPILKHLKKGGYLFVNSPEALTIDECKRDPSTLFMKKTLYYLDAALRDIGQETGVIYRAVPDIDANDFSMYVEYLAEQRTGTVYQAQSPAPKDVIDEEILKPIDELTRRAEPATPQPSTAEIFLSSSLFEGMDFVDREHLNKLLESINVSIIDPDNLLVKARNAKARKDNRIIVMTEGDFIDKKIKDKEAEVTSSLLIVNGNLAGWNYLYIEGVIGLAHAIMRRDVSSIGSYYKLISGKALDADILKLLDKEDKNNIAFALKAILTFEDITAKDGKDLEHYKLMVENYLEKA